MILTEYNYFNVKRLFLLTRCDLAAKQHSILVFSLVTVAVICLYDILLIKGDVAIDLPIAFFSLILFVGGFLVTSHVFTDFHDKNQGIVFLTLPASILEKFFIRWGLTSIVYALGIILLFLLTTYFFAATKSLLTTNLKYLLFVKIPVNQIFICFKYYLLVQPVFFLGACYFRRYSLTKTILCILALIFSWMFLKFLLVGVFLWRDLLASRSVVLQNFTTVTWDMLQLSMLIIAPCCLFLAYLYLRKSEI